MKANSDFTTALRSNRMLSGFLTPTAAESLRKVKPKAADVTPENRGRTADFNLYFRGTISLPKEYWLSGPNFRFSAYKRQRRKTIRKLAMTGMERKMPRIPAISPPAITPKIAAKGWSSILFPMMRGEVT